jgi:hypothetical protein
MLEHTVEDEEDVRERGRENVVTNFFSQNEKLL